MPPAGFEPIIPADLRSRGHWHRLLLFLSFFLYLHIFLKGNFLKKKLVPLYFTIIPTGKLVVNYARSSGRDPSHKMQPQCTGIHAPAPLPPTKHSKCTTSGTVNFKGGRRHLTLHIMKLGNYRRRVCLSVCLSAAGSIKGPLITTNANTLCFRRKENKFKRKSNKDQNFCLQEIFNFPIVRQLISLLRNVRSAHAHLTRMF